MAIRKGGVVAVPTETYYGLAADPENEAALHRLFELKQRPEHKPILVLISRIEQLQGYVASIPQLYGNLIDRYWPGPLTLVFPAKTTVSPLLTGGTGTIGVRLTPHPLACRIIDLLGRPITATSANISRHEPARTALQVRMFFGDRLDFVIDGGPADEGPGSTVVSIVEGKLCLERPGRVPLPGVPICPVTL
jgi:L-threonylcarbamoyladenylate synthase